MEYIEYIERPAGIMIFRIHQAGSIAEIPAAIEGRPVRSLADHIFAKEPSVLYSPGVIRRAVYRGGEWRDAAHLFPADSGEIGQNISSGKEMARRSISAQDEVSGEAALCADAVEVIRIPEGIEEIGNYAFYGCLRLREIYFPSTMRRIGNGMFNGCRLTERLYFEAGKDERTPHILQEVLNSLSNETEAVVLTGGRERYRLHFPEYYEEGKENTPARIIEIIYHGTGHQYRNCFLHRELQFDRYDGIFPLAAAQEMPRTNIRLILDRLRSGPVPAKEAAGRYIDYLRSERAALMDHILSDRDFDPVSELRMLDEKDFYTSTDIDWMIQKASQAGRSDASGFLMDIRRRRFARPSAGKYDL